MQGLALRDIFKLLTGSILARVFGIVSLMLFTRILTKDQMAVFPAFLMIAGLFNLLLDFGTYGTLVKELPLLLREDPLRARSLIVTSAVIVIAGAVVFSTVTLLASQPIAAFVFKDPDQDWIIRFMVPGCFAFVCTRMADTVMWGCGRFGATSFVQIVDSVVRPLLTIGLYFIFGFKGILVGLVFAQIVSAIVSFYYVRDMFLGRFLEFYPFGQLMYKSSPFCIGNFVSYLRGNGDTLLVTSLLGPSALAEYYIAKNLYNNVNLVLAAVDRVAVERLARFSSASDAFSDKVKELHRHISQVAAPIILLVIALTPYAMTVLAGTHYSDTKWPAIALLIAALAQFVFIPVQRAVYVGLPGMYRTVSGSLETAVVLGMAVLLVPVTGTIGIAAAQVMGPVTGSILGLILLRMKFKLILDFYTLMLSIATALPGTLIVLFFAPPVHGIAAAVVAAGIWGVVWGMLFVALTYVFNRPVFENLIAVMLHQYKSIFF